MQEQIQEEDDVTKDVISQYLPTRKRKPRAKKPNQPTASTSGNGESNNLFSPASHLAKQPKETLSGHVLLQPDASVHNNTARTPSITKLWEYKL